MTDTSLTEKPRLVSAGQGFSILNTVSYKGRFLYSKYDPLKSVTAAVGNLHLLPGTLVVVCSPCLWYGLDVLLSTLPKDCMILAIEADPLLYELAKNALEEKKRMLSEAQSALITLLPFSYSGYNSFLEKHGSQGILRRAVRIDFSAGTQFNMALYEDITSAAENTIAQFWKNRLTLVKLGRLYARNTLRNIASLPFDSILENNTKTVARPIIVCGAGESLNHTLSFLSSIKKQQGTLSEYFILAVDAALPVLSAYSIQADGVVGVESQAAIEKAYIGSLESHCTLFADITSRPQVQDILDGKTIWFATQYTEAQYLETLVKNNIITSFIPPLGSVGLVAVYIALLLRRNEKVPIFVTGLDFSFSLGATHAKGTPAHLARLFNSSRTLPVENYDASFRDGAISIPGKNKSATMTDSILQSYATSFKEQFSGKVNLFDCGDCGLDIGIPRAADEALVQAVHDVKKQSEILTTEFEPAADKMFSDSLLQNILRYYEKEHRALVALRDLLKNGDASEYRDISITLNEQIMGLLSERDYLYLHFPDGYKPSCDVGFLKRVRAEIDFFIKDIDYAIKRDNSFKPA